MANKAGLIGTAEAAKKLGFSQGWVQSHAISLGIPCVVINGRYYFYPDDLDSWVDARTINKAPKVSDQTIKVQKGLSPRVSLFNQKSA